MNSGHDINAVDDNRTAIQVTQSRMQNGPPFGFIDRRTGEHRVPLGTNTSLIKQAKQQSASISIDICFGVIQHHIINAGRKISSTGRINQRFKTPIADLGMMRA